MVDSADKVKAFENFTLDGAASDAPAAEEKPAAAQEKPADAPAKKPKKKKAAAAGGGASSLSISSPHLTSLNSQVSRSIRRLLCQLFPRR